MNKTQFQFGITFKTLHGKKREIEGYAMTRDIDRDKDIIPTAVMEKAVEAYLPKGRLLYEHGMDPDYFRKPIGKVYDAYVDDTGMKVKARISDDYIWDKIEKEELQEMSIGAIIEWEALSQNDQIYGVAKNMDLTEVSIVAVPANPQATFSIVKNFELAIEKEENEYNKDRISLKNSKMEEILKNIQSTLKSFGDKDSKIVQLEETIKSLEAEKENLVSKNEALESEKNELSEKLETQKSELESSIKELEAKVGDALSSKEVQDEDLSTKSLEDLHSSLEQKAKKFGIIK